MELLIPAAATIIFTWVLLSILFGREPERDYGIRNDDRSRPVI
jgi:hypothetical protein